jgi:flagellar hook-associated protein 1 FlgK
MSGITGAIDTALSGILAFEAGINTVSENLANQSTPGYGVESVNVTTQIGTAGQPGIGVSAPQISRAANSFAAGLLRAANSAGAAATTQSGTLTDLSNALQNNGDIQTAINQFFNDVSTLAANPASAAQRQTVLADAQGITGAFQSAAATITATQNATTTTLQQGVSTANNLLGQLAVINQGLVRAPNDPNLLDQQQAALNSLSGLLAVNVVPQTGGQVLIASGGTVLLDQSGAQTLTLSGGTAGTAPAITVGTGNTPVTLSAGDGTLGGGLAVWQAAANALQGLNTQATLLAGAVNTAQAQGLTTAGTPGGALLGVPAPSVTAATANAGGATLTAAVTTPSQLPSDGGPFALTYTAGTGWTATDQATSQSYAVTQSGSTLAFAGLTVAVAGTATSGDQFIVNPAPGAAAGIAVTATGPDAIAAADPYVGTQGTLQSSGAIVDNNAGTITPGADTVTTTPASGAAVVPASFYGQTLQVTFTSPTTYNVTTAANPNVTIASGSLSNGSGDLAVGYPVGAAAGQFWQLALSGTPQAGDALTLQPGGSDSGSNAARIAALWSAPGTTSAGSLQQSVVGLQTGLGANAQLAQDLATSTTAQITTATTNLQNISGVSSDQQAVVLTSYSQAYQAAAQVISTAHTMFESLLQAV